MEKTDNPYTILGLGYDADESTIKKAYFKLAKKWHPDKQTTDADQEEATKVFAKIADAYDMLQDPVRRYDWKQANESSIKSSAPSRPSTERTPPVRTMSPKRKRNYSNGTTTPSASNQSSSTRPKSNKASVRVSPEQVKPLVPPSVRVPGARQSVPGRKAGRSPVRTSVRASVGTPDLSSPRSPVRKSTASSVLNSPRSPVRKSSGSSVLNSPRSPVRKSSRSSVLNPPRSTVRSSVRPSAPNPPKSPVRSSVRSSAPHPPKSPVRHSVMPPSPRSPMRKSARSPVRNSITTVRRSHHTPPPPLTSPSGRKKKSAGRKPKKNVLDSNSDHGPNKRADKIFRRLSLKLQ